MKINKITAEEIYQEFCESTHGTYPELQQVWDELSEKYGAIAIGSPIEQLFFATIKFTLQQIQDSNYEDTHSA